MALCNVTGTIYMPDGNPAAVRWVSFVLDVGETVEATYLGAVSPDVIRVRTDNSGNVNVNLITGNYYGFVASRGNSREYRFKAVVPEAPSAVFSDIIEAADPILPMPAWLQQAIDARDDAVSAADRAEAAIGDGKLVAFAALSPADGDVPIFTGATTMSLRKVQASDTDTASGRIVTTRGAYGASYGLSAPQYVGDANVLAAGTRVSMSGSNASNLNLPMASNPFWWLIETAGSQGAGLIQTAAKLNTSPTTDPNVLTTFMRIRNGNGTWGAWRELYNSRNLIGTVSQSGGFPTGAVIEKGANANGEYVRYADGTQICTAFVEHAPDSVTSYTFPAVFVAGPAMSMAGGRGATRPGGATAGARIRNFQRTFVVGESGSQNGWVLNSTEANFPWITGTGETVNICLTAIGRWY